MRRIFALIAFAGFVPTSNAVVVSDKTETITQYLIMSAPSVKVTKTSDPNVAEIRIKPTGHNLVSVAPTPFSRNIPLKHLTNAVWNGIFESKFIPSTLIWSPKHSAERGVLLNVAIKSIDERTGIITMMATVAGTTSPTLSDKASFAGRPIIFGVLQNASITLDDQQGRVIRGDGRSVSAALAPMASSLSQQTVNGCVVQTYASCDNADLQNAMLNGASLYGAYLNSANLSGAQLVAADLTEATMRYANLYLANLSNAFLTNTDLTQATGCYTANIADFWPWKDECAD